MHQLTPSNFKNFHTFRLEWQPGPGGRLDWFAKDHRVNSTFSKTIDGRGQDWVRAFTIKDQSLKNSTGAQIPVEPSYLIMNTAISSTWGFPDDFELTGCKTKCYDCSNVTCACNFRPGFCNMMKSSRVAMYLDYVRVYQSTNNSAHVGKPHTVGCDPVEYPTKEFIIGNEDRYMRAPPFGNDDKNALKKKIKNGGGKCTTNLDCGGVEDFEDNTEVGKAGRGECIEGDFSSGFFNRIQHGSRCKCHNGYTGPYCLADQKQDDELGASALTNNTSLFQNMSRPALPAKFIEILVCMMVAMISVGFIHVSRTRNEIDKSYQRIPSQEDE
jgi:hypothetical protein